MQQFLHKTEEKNIKCQKKLWERYMECLLRVFATYLWSKHEESLLDLFWSLQAVTFGRFNRTCLAAWVTGWAIFTWQSRLMFKTRLKTPNEIYLVQPKAWKHIESKNYFSVPWRPFSSVMNIKEFSWWFLQKTNYIITLHRKDVHSKTIKGIFI